MKEIKKININNHMWLERTHKKQAFLNQLLSLNKQVLLLRGARQVGKTSFVLDAFQSLADHPQILVNLLYSESFDLDGISYLGRDFVGKDPQGTELMQNIEQRLGPLKKLKRPALVFLDEVDRYPLILEAIQSLASFSPWIKFVLTGSNLENIQVSNAATGRKRNFDLYPLTFLEFLLAAGQNNLSQALEKLRLDSPPLSDYLHSQLQKQFQTYLRLGGMPAVLVAYFSGSVGRQELPHLVQDLVLSIEENIKLILGAKIELYQYQDILRSMVRLSLNTLKISHLQVNHTSRAEAKRLLGKTVGARVAHKIRLFSEGKDLSKYLIFDCGVANFLLHGADLLGSSLSETGRAILTETFVGTQLIANALSRDEVFYWKSKNQAELEFLIRSPKLTGIEVKWGSGKNKSLNSFALMEPEANLLVKISDKNLSYQNKYQAQLPNYQGNREIAMLELPHYGAGQLLSMIA